MDRGGYGRSAAPVGRGFRGGGGGRVVGAGAGYGQQIGGPNFRGGGGQWKQDYMLDPRLQRRAQGQLSQVTPTPSRTWDNDSRGMYSGQQQQRTGYGQGYESGRPIVADHNPRTPTPLMEVDTQYTTGDAGGYPLTTDFYPLNSNSTPLGTSAKRKPASSLSAGSSASEGKPKPVLPNQCEIVYDPRSEKIEAYAYRILTSIKNIGLTVDLLFPRAGLSIAEIIRGLNKRGTTFVILINDSNVGRESFTLNILRPVELRAELRNISHEEGVNKMKEVLETISKREEVTAVPENVKASFRSMIQGKFLSDADYQKCIKYVSSRWERQRFYQGKTDFEPGLGIYTDDQLREKIIEILDRGGTENAEEDVPATRVAVAEAETCPGSLRQKISEKLLEIASSGKKARLMAPEAAAKTSNPEQAKAKTSKTSAPAPPPPVKGPTHEHHEDVDSDDRPRSSASRNGQSEPPNNDRSEIIVLE